MNQGNERIENLERIIGRIVANEKVIIDRLVDLSTKAQKHYDTIQRIQALQTAAVITFLAILVLMTASK